MMKKFIVPILSTIVLSTILIVVFQTIPLTPMLASVQGRDVDVLMRALLSLSSVIFSLVVSFVLYSVVAFRRRPGDLTDAKPVYGNVTLEVVWTVIPLLIVLGLGAYGATQVVELHKPPSERAMVVEVTGSMWAWGFFYPDYGFTSTELVMPVDQPMLFHIQTVDVIHSFWIPEFRIKIDAIPGILNHVELTPTEVGSYQAVCAELCGTAHAYMVAPVRVVTMEEFVQWVLEQQEAAGCVGPLADEGSQLANDFGCFGCHATDSHVHLGPSFRGLYGSQRELEDGTVVVADEEYLRNAILLPGAQVVKGFANVMPKDYRERISPEDLQTLIDYIKTLK